MSKELVKITSGDIKDTLRAVNLRLKPVGKVVLEGKELYLETFHNDRRVLLAEGSKRELFYYIHGFRTLAYIHKPALFAQFGIKYVSYYNPADFSRGVDTNRLAEYLEAHPDKCANENLQDVKALFLRGIDPELRLQAKKKHKANKTLRKFAKQLEKKKKPTLKKTTLKKKPTLKKAKNKKSSKRKLFKRS